MSKKPSIKTVTISKKELKKLRRSHASVMAAQTLANEAGKNFCLLDSPLNPPLHDKIAGVTNATDDIAVAQDAKEPSDVFAIDLDDFPSGKSYKVGATEDSDVSTPEEAGEYSDAPTLDLNKLRDEMLGGANPIDAQCIDGRSNLNLVKEGDSPSNIEEDLDDTPDAVFIMITIGSHTEITVGTDRDHYAAALELITPMH